jgi:glycosyltransferase involved in cell wall biosynthesis
MPSETLDAWIVVPAFNEAGVIGDVITALRSVFTNVVCVDDGSVDGTGDIALRAGAHLVSHPVNLGQGAAIQTGVEYARSQPGSRVFATFDADGQHRVEDLVTMIDRLRRDDVDIVIGTRFGAGVSRPPLLKRVVLQTAVRLSRRGRALGLTDSNNGLRVFNKTVADGLDITMNGMSHATEFVTDYSQSKGQPLLNGVNIIVDGFLRKRLPR